MKNLVSVIIPIYNVERYLQRCVDSVLNQTLKDKEIILVDDGSPDKCPQICDEYASKYDEIVVVHKPNGGLASARNAGMNCATGKYILFIDSDDWIDENTLEELVEIAETNSVDFVRFRPMYAGWPNKEDGSLCDFGTEKGMKEGLYQKEQIIKEIYPRLFATPQLSLGVIVAAWRSLYNREFLAKNNLLFYDDVKYSEDTIFSANVVMATSKFYYIDGPKYYHYFFNPTSITKSFKSDRWECYKRLINRFDEDFANRTEYDFTNQLWLQKIYCIISALGQRVLITNMNERVEYCKKICNDPVTVQSMKHIDLVEGSANLKIMLNLVKLKLAFIIARI